MKLKYFLDKKGNKIYTLEEKVDGKIVKDAHYKFVKAPVFSRKGKN
jgi:hypothetical protein